MCGGNSLAVLIIIIFDSFHIFLRLWREECDGRRTKFDYDRPEDFEICLWQKKPGVTTLWVTYRFLMALTYTIYILVIIIIRDHDDCPWYKTAIFFYYWADLLEITCFILNFIITVLRYRRQKKDPELPPTEEMPWYYILLWVAYTTALPSVLVATFVYLAFMFRNDEERQFKYYAELLFVSCLFLFLDFSLSAIPFRLFHIYLPVIFSVTYVVFTIVYQFCGGTGIQGRTSIHEMLDWRDPFSSVKTCTVHTICILVAHCVFTLLYLAKMWLKKRGEPPVVRRQTSQG